MIEQTETNTDIETNTNTNTVDSDDVAESATERASEPTEDTNDVADESIEDSRPSREAAKYRRQLRDTEAERDQLAARVELLLRSQVEHIAENFIDKPAVLWKLGISVDDMINEDGTINPQKAKDIIRSAQVQYGLSRTLHNNYVPNEGKTPKNQSKDAPPAFSAAFGPRNE